MLALHGARKASCTAEPRAARTAHRVQRVAGQTGGLVHVRAWVQAQLRARLQRRLPRAWCRQLHACHHDARHPQQALRMSKDLLSQMLEPQRRTCESRL